LIREIELYKNEQEYQKGKQQLQNVLAQRKQEIMEELNRIRSRPLSLHN
jgi:lantibiotic modifying enzyme